MNQLKTAIRVARRRLDQIERKYAAAFEADHAMCPDGYGSAALDKRYYEDVVNMMIEVAERFGLDSRVHLHSCVSNAEFEEFDRHMNAVKQSKENQL